ncbi:MAG: hypothetical protein ACODAF_05660, partial [Actinomycetota bacterium]
MSVAQGDPGHGGPQRSRRLGVEIGTVLVTAAVVAAAVVGVGMYQRDGSQTDQVAGQPSSPEPAGQSSPDEDEADSQDDEPDEDAETPNEATPPDDESTEAEEAEDAEVTNVELAVDPADYTGRCPVTLGFTARITTNTGPVRADYRWLDGTATTVAEDDVQFGGPGPQGVDVTHEVDVADDATVRRTLQVTEPNSYNSDPAEATVACTPYAEVTKAGDDYTASPCEHKLNFEATITVPHDMTVKYEWLRSDGAIDSAGPYTVEFNDGGQQTRAVPGKTWTLSATGDFGYRIHIIEPYD